MSKRIRSNSPKCESRNSTDTSATTCTSECTPCDPVPHVTIVDRTEGLLRGLVMVLEHHRAPPCIVQALNQQIHTYLDSSESEGLWLKRSKHLLTYPKALYLKQDPPKAPDQVFEPSGALRRWMHNRLKVFNNSNTHLWYSWLQAKRAALPVSDSIVEDTYKDHLALLTKEDDGDEVVIEEIFSDPTFQVVLRDVQDSVLKADLDSFTEMEPSKSAAFSSTRAEGGQQNVLLKLAQFDEEDELSIRDPVLVKMVWVPYSVRAGRPIVKEIYEPEGRLQWETLRKVPREARLLNCTIQAVLEPMKVRVISKGEALPYYKMRNLQKALHGALRRIPCFRLIGRPFLESDLVDLRRRAARSDEWFSIDYSSATDNLSWKYSGRILEEIISVLPEEKRQEALDVLGFHRLHYPTTEDRRIGEFRGVMRRGQLMGSILSFPILCLANLGVYLRTNRIRFRDWCIGDILNHVLINGDDMLYAAPRPFWEEHIRIGRSVGLEMSVGKAYHHKIYSNINSVACHWDLSRADSMVRRIDFLNVGLFFGQHKVQSKEGKAESHHDVQTSMASCFNEVMKGCFRDQKGVALRYLKMHKDALDQESRLCVRWSRESPIGLLVKKREVLRRNYFLPISVGGLGMTPVEGLRYSISSRQRSLAAGLAIAYDKEGCYIDQQRPLRGPEAAELLVVPKVPWGKIKDGIDDGQTICVPELSKSLVQRVFKVVRNGFLVSVRNSHHVLY